MKGIARHTEAIIGPVSRLDCLNGWVLAGGTALAVQLGHRLSEDLAGNSQTVGNGRRDTVDGYSRS